MTVRPAAVALVAVGIVADAVVGVLRAGHATAPIATLCAVTTVAIVAGPRAGMLVGFGAGVVLDLLAGPTSPGGVHALVGLAVGVIAGFGRPRPADPVRGGAAIGAVMVALGVAATLALQGVGIDATGLPTGAAVTGAVAGGLTCPIAACLLAELLSQPVSGA